MVNIGLDCELSNCYANNNGFPWIRGSIGTLGLLLHISIHFSLLVFEDSTYLGEIHTAVLVSQ